MQALVMRCARDLIYLGEEYETLNNSADAVSLGTLLEEKLTLAILDPMCWCLVAHDLLQ